jgi:acetoin utilization deacetylase AcuC-like enzyme
MAAFLATTATLAWPTPVLVITGPEMLAYDHGDHDDHPSRLEAVWDGITDAGCAGIPIRHRPARPATRAELARVHQDYYLDALDAGTLRYGLGTRDCPYSPGLLTAAKHAAGAAAEAATLVLAAAHAPHDEAPPAQPSQPSDKKGAGPEARSLGAPPAAAPPTESSPTRAFAAIRPPGHHAHAGRAGGYCYLNNAMVAAHALLAGGCARVFILDLDFHHGDGTAALVAAEPRCAYGSLHAAPDWSYPGTGRADEHPRLFHEPLPRRPKAGWRAAASRLIAAGAAFAPEALIISLGTDALAGDPVGDLGIPQTDLDDAVKEALATFPTLPVVSLLEGGYDGDNLRIATALHLRTLSSS